MRSKKVDRVKARVDGGQYAEGVVEHLYHLIGVYTIRLTAGGNIVMAPEDTDWYITAEEDPTIAACDWPRVDSRLPHRPRKPKLEGWSHKSAHKVSAAVS